MKNEPMLLNKLKEKVSTKSRKTFGIIGSHHGVGVTHTGLMLAFYMGEELGRKTAYLECNCHHDFSLIQTAYDWSKVEKASFSFRRITCYREVSENRIADILGEHYDCVVLDFGTDIIRNRNEFLRCDTKIVIGGRSEWDHCKLDRFIKSVQTIRGSESWTYLIPYADPKMIIRLRRELNRRIYSLPFWAEPTLPKKTVNRFFNELFI
jgi:hypothetical protein